MTITILEQRKIRYLLQKLYNREQTWSPNHHLTPLNETVNDLVKLATFPDEEVTKRFCILEIELFKIASHKYVTPDVLFRVFNEFDQKHFTKSYFNFDAIPQKIELRDVVWEAACNGHSAAQKHLLKTLQTHKGYNRFLKWYQDNHDIDFKIAAMPPEMIFSLLDWEYKKLEWQFKAEKKQQMKSRLKKEGA
jgi:hypothetical protein